MCDLKLLYLPPYVVHTWVSHLMQSTFTITYSFSMINLLLDVGKPGLLIKWHVSSYKIEHITHWYDLKFQCITQCLQVRHYCDVIIGVMMSQITSLTIFYSTVYSGADQRKHQSSASMAFVWGIHRWPVNSPHKWPLTRKMLPFDGT